MEGNFSISSFGAQGGASSNNIQKDFGFWDRCAERLSLLETV